MQFHTALIAGCTAISLLASASLTAAPVPEAPKFDSRSFLLMDFHSGQILAQQEPDLQLEPASITKVMTSYIVFDELKQGNITLDDMVPISEKAWKLQGSRMFIEVGDKVRLEDLLRGMIIQSGNDATVALAEYVAGGEDTFAQVMNQTAQELGMTGTNFENASGWPGEQHYTTARDIAILSQALIRDFPDYYKYYAEKEFRFNNIKQLNRNRLLWREEGIDGIKTGHTEAAGYCLAASGVRDDMRLVSVVMGTDSEKARLNASAALLNYGFRFFTTEQLFAGDEVIQLARVWKGSVDEVPLGTASDLYVTVPRGERDKLSLSAELQRQIEAPIAKGQTLGKVRAILDGKVIKEVPLVAKQEVPLGGWFSRLIDAVWLWIKSLIS